MLTPFRTLLPAVLFAIALAPPSAHADLFCADSVDGVRLALTLSQDNGQDDQIDIVAGSYSLTTPLTFTSTEANSLTIIGGYTAGCAQLSRSYTVLSGNNMFQILRIVDGSISPSASVHIERVTFLSGKGDNGGGLSIAANYGDVRLETNRFEFNHGNTYNGGLTVSTDGLITLRNNLFVGNEAAEFGAGELRTSNSVAYVIGNTIVGNSLTTPNGSVGGLATGTTGNTHFWLSSNILWNNNANGGLDLYAGAPVILRNNDIGTSFGVVASPQSQDNQSVDPDFAPCGFFCNDFNLKRASPLVDAGDDAAPTGIGAVDLDYKPRKIGPHVDIGAFEEDVLFADGFE